MSAPAAEVKVPESLKRPPACLRPCATGRAECAHYNHPDELAGIERNRDFSYPKKLPSELDIIQEAKRCLKCQDAPCARGCPTQVRVDQMMANLAEGNFYGAAKVLFTHNPLGWTCGMLCPTNHVCRGACSLHDSMLGSININLLQSSTAEVFAHMNIPQIRNPKIVDTPNLNARVALVGAGPASLSCATYLARLGYKNVTILEKQSFAGGIPAIEIPQFRIPYAISRFEVKLVEDLGVHFEFNKALGRDYTLASLKEQYDAVFVGVGYAEANSIPVFKKAGKLSNVWNSKDFLSQVGAASKPGMTTPQPLPALDGHVIIVGAGDVASDVCLTAWRCGAKKVTMVFRRGHVDMRCNEDEAEGLRREKVEFISCASPKSLRIVEGRATALECEVMNKELDGKYVQDHGQTRWIECDHIITAFGSQIAAAEMFAPAQINTKTWSVDCNRETMQATGLDWCFTGGDCSGSATIIEAVNDGKVAAWNMHRFLASKHSIAVPAVCTEVPPFMTPLDLVDTSVQVGPFKFVNPFGLASGPSTENAVMIKRAFRAGWGWAISKTFQADKDMLPNLTPRIVGDSRKNEYLNIELNSERKMDYWLTELPKIKKEFPDRILFAAIHCKGSLDEWKDIATRVAATGVDGLQINMGCPNLGEAHYRPFTEIVRETMAAVTSVVRIPCMPKLGPHQGDVVALARAAKEGGAWGVSCINTIPGLYEVGSDAVVWPSIAGTWAFGGVSGAAVRPFALHTVAAIKAAMPDLPVLGCGGIQSAKTALEFIHMGASVVQVCSASMHAGFGLVDPMMEGLKYHLYMQGRPDLRAWGSQYPPALRALRATPKRFGPYEHQQRAHEIEECLRAPLPSPQAAEMLALVAERHGRVVAEPAGSLQQEIGRSQPAMRPFGELSHEYRTVSSVDVSRCVGCGRCQTACMDAGYAAIAFDRTARVVKINPSCKGCGLCVAVCPVGAISTVMKPAAAAKAN